MSKQGFWTRLVSTVKGENKLEMVPANADTKKNKHQKIVQITHWN